MMQYTKTARPMQGKNYFFSKKFKVPDKCPLTTKKPVLQQKNQARGDFIRVPPTNFKNCFWGLDADYADQRRFLIVFYFYISAKLASKIPTALICEISV